MQHGTDLVLSKNNNPLCTVESLPVEVLLKIFMHNTEFMHNTKLDDPWHNRLHDARHSSQVCRLWRESLLGSPCVWDRLLDLGYYNHARVEWREELFSRVGNALLWITGSLSVSTAPFLYSVLDKKWQNVQILDITCLLGLVVCNGDREIWPFLTREAPSLESINLQHFYYYGQPHPHESSSVMLFNGFAPRLRDFHDSSGSIAFESNAPWLATLRSLRLKMKPAIPGTMSILKSTPQLRSLHATGVGEDTEFMDYIELDIPPLMHFECLELIGCPIFLTLLLESIPLPSKRPALRRFHIGSCLHGHCDLHPETLQRMRRACDKWIQAYFDDFPPQSIHVSEHGQQHIHKLIIGDSRGGLQLMVVDSGHPFIPMLGASSAFSAVTHLRIHPGPQLAFWAPLCKAFHSVIELSVEGPGAKTEELFDIVNQLFLFPSLRTLQWDVEGMDLFPKILIFLEHRASIGSPLSALCLKPVDIDRLSDTHRDRLDKIAGLVLRATP